MCVNAVQQWPVSQRSWVQIPYRPEFFSGLIFTTAQVVFIIAKISFIFTSLSAVQIYDFHIFTAVYSPLHGFIWNQHSDQLPVGLLAQLVEHCTGIAEVMGSNPVQAWIFSGLIFTTAQVVFITAKITFIFTSFTAVQMYDFHIFTTVDDHYSE